MPRQLAHWEDFKKEAQCYSVRGAARSRRQLVDFFPVSEEAPIWTMLTENPLAARWPHVASLVHSSRAAPAYVLCRAYVSQSLRRNLSDCGCTVGASTTVASSSSSAADCSATREQAKMSSVLCLHLVCVCYRF